MERQTGRRRILVVGAGGYLGTEVVRALASGGAEVVGVVRSVRSALRVQRAGGIPKIGDILEPKYLARFARGCSVLVHLAAGALDGSADSPEAERVRVEGARNLVATAALRRPSSVVLGSGYWVYDSSVGPISEESPVHPEGEARVNHAAELTAMEEGHRLGVAVSVLRPGMVYGHGSWLEGIVDSLRDGSYATAEGGRNLWSFVSLPDAAVAFRAVIERGTPGATYNVGDGAPASWREFVEFVSDRLELPRPPDIDGATLASRSGDAVARHLLANRAMPADRLRALGWAPRYPSFREGVPALWPGMAR